LEPILMKAVAEKREIKFTTPSGMKHLVKLLDTPTLLAMERTPQIDQELLFRPGMRDELRREVITNIARANQKKEMQILFEALALPELNESLAFDYIRLLTSRPQPDLIAHRDDLKQLIAAGKTPLTRQLGFVALIAADGTTEDAWKLGTQSISAL